MGQLITTIVSIMLLLLVPLGIVQVHTAIQMENELLDVSMAATKYISNRGGKNDADVQMSVVSYIQQELSQKMYHLKPQDVKLAISRTNKHHPVLWSHEDEFQISMEIPYPALTQLFASWQRPLLIVRTGTINTMDYDL